MLRLLLLKIFLIAHLALTAQSILVNNMDELNKATNNATPGAIIILKDGTWNNVTIKLNCKGTKEKPITFKAQTPGKVILQGQSRLGLGGEFIIVDGLYFKNGFAGEKAVIEYRTSEAQVANNCRVTNCWIDNFNNPKRMDENYWVALYGKNNRLDHCSFTNKKNIGVLLAVILDDDRSRENFHSIDHNYFGKRIPLASNGGEIIRVGVSQHCQFNSNTQIIDNFFEHCDGETEIVSIKSGSNLVKNNLFKECQGGVVLRHGDNNTVENNIFLGNNKRGTGGVRVINKGQWVVNNFFYRCRGVDFRSPLSIMNGIPNSPANRYVQVTDAVIANNTFMECSPISLCEGSDAERTLPPDNVLLFNNLFRNSFDSTLYHVFDNTDGIRFIGNEVNKGYQFKSKKRLDQLFNPADQEIAKSLPVLLPVSMVKGAVRLPDSLGKVSQSRLGHWLSTKPGFSDISLLKKIEANAYTATGPAWQKKSLQVKFQKPKTVKCATTEEILAQLKKKEPLIIELKSKSYLINEPLVIASDISFTGQKKSTVLFNTGKIRSAFVIAGGGKLRFDAIRIDGSGVQATNFISSDDAGSSDHYSLFIVATVIRNLSKKNGCENLFFAHKSMVADSLLLLHSSFENNETNGVMMKEEKDNKGYYNAENIIVSRNAFLNQNGQLLNVYRGGNDESTMGPRLLVGENSLVNCSTADDSPLIILTGVQYSEIAQNKISDSNPGKTLVKYVDTVRARHLVGENVILNSGSLEKNQFVKDYTYLNK